jgi:hypothetical protein
MADAEARREVRAGLLRLRPEADRFRAQLHRRLLRTAPAAAERVERWLESSASLTQMLIQTLDQAASDPLVDALWTELGRSAYGVLSPDDLALVGSALIGTARDLLAGDFTPDIEDAWVRYCAYAALRMERGLSLAAS